MENKFEGIAVFFVGLLSLLIVVMIVMYNFIDETSSDFDISSQIVSNTVNVKESTDDYLKKMENYEEKDTGESVRGGEEESEANSVTLKKVELKNDDVVNAISAAVDDALEN